MTRRGIAIKGIHQVRLYRQKRQYQKKYRSRDRVTQSKVHGSTYQKLMFGMAFFMLIFLTHIVMKMNLYITIVVTIVMTMLLPQHLKRYREKGKQEERVLEASVYMDTMLYAFLKEGKIDTALEDVIHSLPEGNLKEVAKQALKHMHLTFDETEVINDSLQMIEKVYNCKRIQNMHQFMLHVEFYGGEIRKPIELLIRDKEMWEIRVRAAMQEREKMFGEVVLSIITSMLICGIVLYLPVLNVDISGNWITQICTMVVIVLNECIFLRAQRYLTCDWLALDECNDDEFYESKMEEWKNYNEPRERKFSFLLGSIALVIGTTCLWKGLQWVGVFVMLASIVLYNQHLIGHNMVKRKLVKEIKRAFPNWLMDLVLLLQSENVQVALFKSQSNVPGVLKEELHQLVARLEMDPESAFPYHEFLGKFKISEIQAAMSMLYSMSAGHGGNVSQQIGDLIERNQEMLNVAEMQKNKDLNAGMYLLFLAPVLTASLKMVVDMAVFMLSFLSTSMF